MNNEQATEKSKKEEALGSLKKFLGLEHFGWKVGGIVILASAGILIFLSIILIIIGIVTMADAKDPTTGVAPMVFSLTMGIAYLIVSLIGFIPSGIISLMMIKKVEYYQSTLDTDISIARKRCTSIGMIVFCALFNTLATVFYVINFITIKKNAAAFDEIEADQKG